MARGTEDAVLALARELAEVSRLVEDDDVTGTVRRFLTRLAGTVPGCDHALITVRTDTGPETVESTDAHPPSGPGGGWSDGPIAEALDYREPRRVEDTATDRRWLPFAARLAAEGYRSCLVLPLPTERSPTAALTLLSRRPHQFDDHVYDVVLLLTLHAGVVFDNAQLFHHNRQLVGHLTAALNTRHTIGRAQGVLMHRFACDTDSAFALLKRASQTSNTKLRDVAASLITAHEEDRLAEALAGFGMAGGVLRRG